MLRTEPIGPLKLPGPLVTPFVWLTSALKALNMSLLFINVRVRNMIILLVRNTYFFQSILKQLKLCKLSERP